MFGSSGGAGHALALCMSCGFFMTCSAGMMIINKMVRTPAKHATSTCFDRVVCLPHRQVLRAVNLPMTLVMIQMAFTVLVLCATPCGLHFGSFKHVLRWSLTVPLLFAAMLASSMLALRYSSMGAIVVVRNMAPLVSLCIEGVVTGEKIEIDVWTILSLVVVLGGVVLYVSHDIAFSAIGMGCMLFNMTAAVRPARRWPRRDPRALTLTP